LPPSPRLPPQFRRLRMGCWDYQRAPLLPFAGLDGSVRTRAPAWTPRAWVHAFLFVSWTHLSSRTWFPVHAAVFVCFCRSTARLRFSDATRAFSVRLHTTTQFVAHYTALPFTPVSGYHRLDYRTPRHAHTLHFHGLPRTPSLDAAPASLVTARTLRTYHHRTRTNLFTSGFTAGLPATRVWFIHSSHGSLRGFLYSRRITTELTGLVHGSFSPCPYAQTWLRSGRTAHYHTAFCFFACGRFTFFAFMPVPLHTTHAAFLHIHLPPHFADGFLRTLPARTFTSRSFSPDLRSVAPAH